MNWDAISAVGEIFGASVVFVSLFYVGFQVRENSRAVRGQTYQSLCTTISEQATQTAADPELSVLMIKGAREGAFSEVEEARFLAMLNASVRVATATHYQFSLGLLDAEQLHELTMTSQAMLSSSPGQRFWTATKANRSEAFVTYMEDAMASGSTATDLKQAWNRETS